MGFFGSGDKTTSSTDARQGASDDAILIGAGAAGARDSATSISTGIGSNSNIGGTMVQGSNLTSLANSLQNSTNTGTITFGETGLGQKFADTVEKLTKDNNDSLARFINGTTASVLPNAATDLPNTSDKKDENTITDKLKTWLPVIAAALAVAWFLFWRRK